MCRVDSILGCSPLKTVSGSYNQHMNTPRFLQFLDAMDVIVSRAQPESALLDESEDALKLLAGDADQAFVAAREELKGDLLVKLDRSDEALQAYEKAKAALTAEAAVGGLQIKIDDLAKGDA